ncbi:hypothetical protein HZS_192 [Henneguya salminicola]|nr:hypothetical protein HZS_192 [Henneguya salminicola]
MIPSSQKCRKCKEDQKIRNLNAQNGISLSWKCLVKKMILITYCFCSSFSTGMTINETSIFGEKISRETVVDGYTYCMEGRLPPNYRTKKWTDWGIDPLWRSTRPNLANSNTIGDDLLLAFGL